MEIDQATAVSLLILVALVFLSFLRTKYGRLGNDGDRASSGHSITKMLDDVDEVYGLRGAKRGKAHRLLGLAPLPFSFCQKGKRGKW